MTTIKRKNSWRSEWLKLDKLTQIEHILSNSELYRRVRHYEKLARNINKPVQDEHTSK